MSPRFAWPQFRKPFQLAVGVTSPSLPDDAFDATARRIRLDKTPGWKEATLTFALTTTEAPAAGIGSLTAYVLIASAVTNTRLPVKLTQKTQTEYEGTATVPESTLAGAVSVTGEVVADGDWGVRSVGASLPWTIVVDASAAPTPPGAPPFDIVWVDFASDQAPSDAKPLAYSSYALMHVDGDKPTLYLNDGVEGFRGVLTSPRPRDEKKRLRNLLGAQVAHYAACTLFDEAILQSDVTDDVATLPTNPLLSQLIQAVAGEIDAVDPEELIIALLSDGAERHQMRGKVDDALTTLTNLSSHVIENVKVVFNG